MPEIQGAQCNDSLKMSPAHNDNQPQLILMETNAAGQSSPVLGFSSEQSSGLNNDRVPTAKASGITLEYYLPNNSLTNN